MVLFEMSAALLERKPHDVNGWFYLFVLLSSGKSGSGVLYRDVGVLRVLRSDDLVQRFAAHGSPQRLRGRLRHG